MSPTTLCEERRVYSEPASLLDLLDRLLDKGVVADGEILLTVADIDLVYVGLKCILASVETIRANPGESDGSSGGAAVRCVVSPSSRGETPVPNGITEASETEGCEELCANDELARAPRNEETNNRGEEGKDFFGEAQRSESALKSPSGSKVDVDPKKVEKGLVKLVLTVVDLLRKLMERQAIRRMEGGSLSRKKMEELGEAFLRLNEKMEELKKFFGLTDEDLNLNLGPLGNVT